MIYNNGDYGEAEKSLLTRSPYFSDNDAQGIAPHPGHLFKLLTGTNFLLLTGEYFLLLG